MELICVSSDCISSWACSLEHGLEALISSSETEICLQKDSALERQLPVWICPPYRDEDALPCLTWKEHFPDEFHILKDTDLPRGQYRRATSNAQKFHFYNHGYTPPLLINNILSVSDGEMPYRIHSRAVVSRSTSCSFSRDKR